MYTRYPGSLTSAPDTACVLIVSRPARRCSRDSNPFFLPPKSIFICRDIDCVVCCNFNNSFPCNNIIIYKINSSILETESGEDKCTRNLQLVGYIKNAPCIARDHFFEYSVAFLSIFALRIYMHSVVVLSILHCHFYAEYGIVVHFFIVSFPLNTRFVYTLCITTVLLHYSIFLMFSEYIFH